jgi:hypothetical protein
LAEQIKVITNGGGTSQGVLDTLTSLQNQINTIAQALVFAGSWNASTNTPTLTSSVGVANNFYIVSVAGSTNLDGITNWGVGDWAIYNGTVWQRLEGGAAGNFTELSVSGVATFSAGTANGVTYLNGSKVLTSGSALVFDGTNLSVGTTALSGGKFSTLADLTAANGLVIRDSATTYANNDNYVLLQNSTGVTVGGLTHPAANSLGVWGNDDIRFLQSAAATERMRITSTGLGIGTSSPNTNLEIAGNSATTGPSLRLSNLADAINAGGVLGTVEFYTGDNSGGGDSVVSSIQAIAENTSPASTSSLLFKTGANTERLRIDSAGNVGIGTTVPNTKLEISGNNDGGASNNTLRFSDSDISSGVNQPTGRIEFYTSDATPGPAGVHSFILSSTEGTTGLGALSFGTGQSGSAAERMRIDSSGNVGIGVTPTNKLDVSGTGSVIAQIAGTTRASLRLKGSFAGTTDIGHFSVFNASDIEVSDIFTTSDDTATPTSRTEFSVSVAGASVELMRLSGSVGTVFNEDGGDYDFRVESDTNTHALFVQGSDGNVGIGTASPTTKAQITRTALTGFLSRTSATLTLEDTAGTELYFASNTAGYGQLRFGDTDSNFRGAFTYDHSVDAMYFVTAGTERMRIDSSGNVGIGTTTPAGLLQVQSNLAGNNQILLTNIASSNSGAGSEIVFTQGASGYAAGKIQCDREGSYSATASSQDSALVFFTATDGVDAEQLRITSSGNVLVTGAGGLGYGTGSGGAVTQATSRTTGVTLNKTNGAITLVSAAGLATFQSFTVTNSTVAATDVVHVTQKSGTDLYQIFVTATAAGSFRITFATTGGTTTEQPVFNFAVIKAVTA